MFYIAGGGVWSHWLAKLTNLKLIYNPFLIKNKQIRLAQHNSLHTFSPQMGKNKSRNPNLHLSIYICNIVSQIPTILNAEDFMC